MNTKPHGRAAAGRERELSKEEFWREALREFAAGGQSVRAFCRARNFSEPSFYAWRRTLAERDEASSRQRASPPAFVPVHVSPEIHSCIEIVLAPGAPGRGGRRIRLRGPVDRAALMEVLAALEPVQAQER